MIYTVKERLRLRLRYFLRGGQNNYFGTYLEYRESESASYALESARIARANHFRGELWGS